MCLVDNKKFRISTKPIKVYKMVLEFEHSKRIMSPYKDSPLHKGLNFAGFGQPIDQSYTVNKEKINAFSFGAGFIHAYEKLKDANDTARRNNIITMICSGYSYRVVECYIHPFTRYAIEHDYNTDVTTLCSRFLWIGKTVY